MKFSWKEGVIALTVLLFIPVWGLGQSGCEMPTDRWKFLGLQDSTIDEFSADSEQNLLVATENTLMHTSSCGDIWNVRLRWSDERFYDLDRHPFQDSVYVFARHYFWVTAVNGETFKRKSLLNYLGAMPSLGEFTFHPVDSQTRFLSVVGGMPVIPPPPSLKISRNAGEDWSYLSKDTLIAHGLMEIQHQQSGGYYVFGQKIDTTVADSIDYRVENEIFHITDQEENWRELNLPVDSVEQVQIFNVPEKFPEQVYLASADTIYYSEDEGRTWESVVALPDSVSRIRETTFYEDQHLSYSLFFTTRDEGIYRLDIGDGSIELYETLPISNPGMFHVDKANGIMYTANDGEGIYGRKLSTATSIRTPGDAPDTYQLKANYPNPFNPSTKIQFSLPEATEVQLTLYNTIGKKIETLTNRHMTAGSHSVTFNAVGLPSGVYIYRLKAGEYSESRKMILVK